MPKTSRAAFDPRDESTWTAVDKRRMARAFRHHVKTKWNPRGRIVRLDCVFWGGWRGIPQPDTCMGDLVDAHHVDYSRPFAVVWLCKTCHARVHRRKLYVLPSMVCDYTSLVANIQRKGAAKKQVDRIFPMEQAPF